MTVLPPSEQSMNTKRQELKGKSMLPQCVKPGVGLHLVGTRLHQCGVVTFPNCSTV